VKIKEILMKKLIVGLVFVMILAVTMAGCAKSSSVPSPGKTYTSYPMTTTTIASRANGSTPKFYDPNTGQYFDTAQQLDSYQAAYKVDRDGTGVIPTPAPQVSWSSESGAGSSVISGSDEYYTDRMVVRTGEISIVVKDIAGALDSISKLAVEYGGYVVSSQKWKEGERNNGNISFRVLAENYDKAVSALRNLSLDVINETTHSQDVTQEYSDLGASLKNLEATETQLLKIMENATKTEDILSIQRELTNVRGQVEQTKGRMLYLERTSSTSLINVQLSEALLSLKFSADKVRADIDENIRFTAEINGGFEPYNFLWDFGDGNTSIDRSPVHAYKDSGTYSVSVTVTDDKGYTNSSRRGEYITVTGNWNPGSVAKSAWNGLSAFGRGFINVVIWLGIFSPIWIVIGGVIWFIVWKSRRKKS
jgi:PKD repeat protein